MGQPNDAFHQYLHKFRKAYDRAWIQSTSNVLLRQTMKSLEFDSFSAAPPKLPLAAALKADLYSWRCLPEKVIRWAWRLSHPWQSTG